MSARREVAFSKHAQRRTLLGTLFVGILMAAVSARAQDAGAPAAPPEAPAAAPAKATQAATSEPCTTGCHDHDEVQNPNPEHAKLKCAQCHPNVTNGQEPHAGAMDDMGTEKMCALAGCHTETAEKQQAGKHKDASCETCHLFVHDDFTRFDKKTCKGGCHNDQLAEFEKSVHATAKKPASCVDCHGDLHDVKVHKDPLSPMSKVLQVTTCAECHDSQYVRDYRTSVHGEGVLRSGLEVAPTCSDCHGSHGIVSKKDPQALIGRENVTNTCGKCHTFIVARWKNSTHGQLWVNHEKGKREGKEGPVCTSCHPGHRTFDPKVYGNHLKMADRCGECHESQNISYRDSFHGKATRMGYQVAATCADCHTPHEMLPADDPKSSVHPDHLQATCQRCHPGTNGSFSKFDPHLDPSKPGGKDPIVHYIWFFMTYLLLGTFAFFGVHTLLWLQRSLVGFARHEFHHATDGEVWIRRFKPPHIYVHLTIVVTFLLLAATGLPLKFSNLEWARPIGSLFGGITSTRFLHRVAGVLTFAYAAFFVWYLTHEIVTKKRRELLFGWQSMVPNLRDLKDLWGNVKWFFYLGKRPRLDRWAYWEKFDFFAVFWGVPVIGLSGLMLWIPGWTAKIFPGWVLNVAYLIHSDEALLATGFIFFFHFFHTHLRPEAFPLDPVIFLGAMPLERFKDERPDEYERLIKSGELEQYKVARPSELAMKRARRFGFTALAVGVVLGTLLLVTGLKALLKW